MLIYSDEVPEAAHYCRAEGALSIVAPENIVENKDVLLTKIVIFAIFQRALTEVRQLRRYNHAPETLLPTIN